MGHGDRFLVPYLLFKKSTVWDKEPVPVSHPPAKKPARMELAFLVPDYLSSSRRLRYSTAVIMAAMARPSIAR